MMRHLLRHPLLYGLMTLVFTLMAGLLAALPLIATQLAADSLQRDIARLHAAERHLLLTGDHIPAEINDRLQTTLGPLYQDTFELRQFSLLAQPFAQREGQLELFPPQLFDALMLHLYSFDDLDSYVTLLDGQLPRPQPVVVNPTPDDEIPVLEAVIGPTTAELLSLKLGDVLQDRNGRVAYKIVGLVEAIDPQDPRWWGDESLPFSFWRRISLQPDLIEVNAGVILHPDDMARYYPGNVSWRVLLHGERLNPLNAVDVASQIRNLETTLTSQQVALDSPLLTLLGRYLSDVETGRLALLLLGSQSLLAILYMLHLLGQLVLEQTAAELRTLSARGFSIWRLTGQFGLRYGLLALAISWPIGVLGAATILWRWPLAPAGQLPWGAPPLSWGLAAAALLIGWLILIVPLPRTIRRTLIEERQPLVGQRSRGLVIDLVLLALGGLSFWQLRQFLDQATAADEALVLDPLLLLAPTLLFLAAALLLRHLAPLIIGLLARRSRRSRAALAPIALTWLARDQVRAGRLALLVTLATGLAVFATLFVQSLAVRQQEMADYQSGSDLRFSIPRRQMDEAVTALAEDGRVEAITPLFRATAIPPLVIPDPANQLNLLAVDLSAPVALNGYPTGLSDYPLEALLALLKDPPPDAIPVLISRRYVVPDTTLFQRTTMQIGRDEVAVEIRGIIEAFPTLRPPFVVANLADVQAVLDQQPLVLDFENHYELAVGLTPGQSGEAVLADLPRPEVGSAPLLLGDAAALHEQLRTHLLARQISGMFRFNALLLVLLTTGMLLLLLLLDGRQRQPALGVLTSLGVSRRGLIRLMISEGVALTAVGGLLGLGVGIGLARLTQPLLSLTLSTALGGADTVPLVMNRWEIALLLCSIVVLYLTIILMAARVIAHFDSGRLLRV